MRGVSGAGAGELRKCSQAVQGESLRRSRGCDGRGKHDT